MNERNMKRKNKKKMNTMNLTLLVCLVLIVVAVILRFMPEQKKEEISDEHVTEMQDVQVDELKQVAINLGHGMYITEVGKYSGVYMEDGSDEMVSDVLMLTVKNEGENAVQYAEIHLLMENESAFFTLSTLPAGSTAILLEQNRKAYVPGEYNTAVAENVVLFTEPLSLCEDRVKIQPLDGAVNVSNISDQDIAGDIVIYYKNCSSDAYYGGITYRIRIEGGLKAGEIKQVMASHYSDTGSRIMFVTCGENG